MSINVSILLFKTKYDPRAFLSNPSSATLDTFMDKNIDVLSSLLSYEYMRRRARAFTWASPTPWAFALDVKKLRVVIRVLNSSLSQKRPILEDPIKGR